MITITGLNSFFDKINNFLIFLGICFLISIIIYYIFGIYILVDEYKIFETFENECNSKIWYYILLSLLAFGDKLLLRKIESIASYSNTYYLLFGIEAMLVIFGGIEIFSKKCIYDYNFKNTKMYDFSLFNFSIQIIILFLIIYKIVIMNKDKKKQNEENNIGFNYINRNMNDTNIEYSYDYIDNNFDYIYTENISEV